MINEKEYILNNILQEVKPLKLREKIYWRIKDFVDKKRNEDDLIKFPRAFQSTNGIGWIVEYIGDCGWVRSEYHSCEIDAKARLKELELERK